MRQRGANPQLVQELLNQNLPLTQIAAQLKINTGKLRKIIRQHGLITWSISRENLQSMIKAGYTVTEMANRCRCSHYIVRKWAKTHGLNIDPFTTRGYQPVEQVKEMIKAGKTCNEICAATGMNYYRLHRFGSAHNIKIPTNYVRRGPKNKINHAQLEVLLDMGVRQIEIARVLGVTRQAISDYIKRNHMYKEHP